MRRETEEHDTKKAVAPAATAASAATAALRCVGLDCVPLHGTLIAAGLALALATMSFSRAPKGHHSPVPDLHVHSGRRPTIIS